MTNIYSSIFGNPIHANAVATIVKNGECERILTYSTFQDAVDSARADICIGAGETVALVMPNSLELMVGLFAIWAEGAAAAPLNPAYTAQECKALFDDLHVQTVLIRPGDEKIRSVLLATKSSLRIVEVAIDEERHRNSAARAANPDNNVALYLHTSGTTGKPKAVPLRHSNLIRGARNVAETYDLRTEDRTYLVMVLFHIHGIIAALLAPLITGGSIVLPPALDASRAWTDFKETSCNWITATPSIHQALLAAPCPGGPPTLRFVRSCSSPLLPTVFKALRERFQCPVLEAYAMTEACHQMCSNRLERFGSGSVGSEAGGVKICIWANGHVCEPGTPGEVCVTGENVMNGYEGVSQETNDCAFWYGADERGYEARWFRTGDLGVLSTDGRRRLTLIGRKSEMINRGGEKISPVEVDEALMLCSGDVREAASFSVRHDFYGQEVEAAVVLQKASTLTEVQLQELLAQRLAGFKIPKRIHFCEDKIPKGPTGKIQRNVLSRIFAGSPQAGGHGKENGSGKQSDTGDVYTIVERSLSLPKGTARQHLTSALLELGADSLTLAKIVTEAKRAGKRLDIASLFSYPTVQGVVDMIDRAPSFETQSNSIKDAEEVSKVKPFALLQAEKSAFKSMCAEARVKPEDSEDAFPLSASQKSYLDAFIGRHHNTHLMWQLSRYQLRKGTVRDRLLEALTTLQQHEQSLRWVMAKDPRSGWVTLQLRAGTESRVEVIECTSSEEADQVLGSRLVACRTIPGAKTAIIYVVAAKDQDLELAFIESHLYTEGPGRIQMLEALGDIYDGTSPRNYTPYTAFIQRFPSGQDNTRDIAFWRKDMSAFEHGEGEDWPTKSHALLNIAHAWQEDVFDIPFQTAFVYGPWHKLTAHTGISLPLIAEACFALALALYFSQCNAVFARGAVAYDRCTSFRMAHPEFSDVRAVTGWYHPNFVSAKLAEESLWTYLQYFKAVTQAREQKLCVDSAVEFARHSVAFTWRFHDSAVDEKTSDALVLRVKNERVDFRGFKMCYGYVNRHGADGLRVVIDSHPSWLENQRAQGAKVDLIKIVTQVMQICVENFDRLERLRLDNLAKGLSVQGDKVPVAS